MPAPLFQKSIPLAKHTTFRIGGPAQAFIQARSADEVVEAVWKAEGMGLPWQVIGHGSNILASDTGYPGAVIVFKDETPPRIDDDDTVTASGGAGLWGLIDFMAGSGLAGLEDLAGIPGTVGGAICGNAGAYGMAIGERIDSVLLLDRNGSMRKVYREDLKFTYRGSSIKENGFVVLEATFSTRIEDPSTIREAVEDRLADRAKKHPDPDLVCTAGSFFKNPVSEDGKRIAAGRLIEEAGCKGFRVGGASLWDTHANIIVTDGNALAKDVKKLAQLISGRVGEHWGIDLTPEVSYLGQH
jgi:UDP-N-acetylmuramate dehydrogenase